MKCLQDARMVDEEAIKNICLTEEDDIPSLG